MVSTLLLRARSSSDHLLSPLLQLPQILIQTRSMGGGPRTFPGGLSKWQYRRMQDKLAREKANRLLRTEKQVYSGQPDSRSKSYMSPKDRIKVLADRFTKPGAEDLWNKDDGPLSDPHKKLVKDPTKIPQLSAGSFVQKREYSAGRKWRSNPSSEEESESELDSVRGFRRNPVFSSVPIKETKYNVTREKSLGEQRRSRSKRLGEERRSRLKEIQQIRDEFRSIKEIARTEEKWVAPKGDSLISKKRFCLFIKEKK